MPRGAMTNTMDTTNSFLRFMGETPYVLNETASRKLTELEQRGVVWISRLSEPPFEQLRPRVAGRSVLALGSCEGNLEWHLAAAGAARVTGVEGYADNFGKCGVLEALFPELPLDFRLADVETFDLPGDYDVVICPGILYHLKQPARLLEKVRAAKPAHFFLSTQLAVNPPHPAFKRYRLAEIAEVSCATGRYFGRRCPDRRGGPTDYRSGLHEGASFWFFPGDLRRLLDDLGFDIVQWSVADLGARGMVAIVEMRTPPPS